jgi:hypothetical protein
MIVLVTLVAGANRPRINEGPWDVIFRVCNVKLVINLVQMTPSDHRSMMKVSNKSV